jgi:hypothetical protein
MMRRNNKNIDKQCLREITVVVSILSMEIIRSRIKEKNERIRK